MFNVYQGSEYIEDILATLEAFGFKATFFVGGSWAAANEPLMKRMLAKGHELGNHGFYHKDMAKCDEKTNLAEIKNCNDIVLALTGFEITLFAPPSGSYSSTTIEAAEKLSMKTIMWTRDTIDWRDKDSAIITSRALKNLSAGDLVLMHPTKDTLKALSEICKKIAESGLTASTVSEVIA